MYKLGFEEAEEPGIKLPIYNGSWRKQGNSRKTSNSVSLTMLTYLRVHLKKLWKILKDMGIPDDLTCLLRNLYAGQEATVSCFLQLTILPELDMEQQTGSKQEKEYIKAVFCDPTYLTYMQSISCKMLGWMKHKLESRLREKYQ